MGEAANDYCTTRPAKEVKPFLLFMYLMYFLQRILDIRLLLNVSLKLFYKQWTKTWTINGWCVCIVAWGLLLQQTLVVF